MQKSRGPAGGGGRVGGGVSCGLKLVIVKMQKKAGVGGSGRGEGTPRIKVIVIMQKKVRGEGSGRGEGYTKN